MNGGRYERLIFSHCITPLACGTVREAMWYMKIKTLTIWAGDFTSEAESEGRQILLNFNEILDTTPRVSLLEKQHLRLITAESLWVNTCNPAWGFQSWNIGRSGRRFAQEWWEAIPLAGPSKPLCSCFCCLRATGAYPACGACHREKGRTGRVTVLPHPSLSSSPRFPQCPGAGWEGGREPQLYLNRRVRLWGWFFFTTVIIAWPIGNISGFVLVYGRWRGVIITSFPFWACFLNRILFLHRARFFFWWLQELKCSSSLQV